MSFKGDKGILKKVLKIQDEIMKFSPEIPNILNLLSEENVSIKKLANFIENDVVLSAKILRIANSPFYGIPKKIGSIEDALILMGINTVKVLIISIYTFPMLKDEILDLQKHSIRVASFSKTLSEFCKISNISEIFTSGLLHDFGKILMKQIFKEKYTEFLNNFYSLSFEKEGVQSFKIVEMEEKNFGISHASIGAYILNRWYFPDRIVEVIKYHHNPEKAKNYKQETCIVFVANILDYLLNPFISQKENESVKHSNVQDAKGLDESESEMIKLIENNIHIFSKAGVSSLSKEMINKLITEEIQAEELFNELFS